jgi:hypothetical protein
MLLKKIKRYLRGKPLFKPQELLRYYNRGDPYLDLYETARSATGSEDNFAKQCRFFTLYQAALHILKKSIRGDVVECGCWHGHSTYMVASLLQVHSFAGRFLVFDSFEGGLSDKTAQDRVAAGNTDSDATARQKQFFASSYDEVSDALSQFQFVSLHRGWIPQVFRASDASKRRFALAHIDVDLYAPTHDSLSYFLPRMVPGGIIVVDDYGYSNFPGATTAVNEVLTKSTISLFIVGHIGGCLIVI